MLCKIWVSRFLSFFLFFSSFYFYPKNPTCITFDLIKRSSVLFLCFLDRHTKGKVEKSADEDHIKPKVKTSTSVLSSPPGLLVDIGCD